VEALVQTEVADKEIPTPPAEDHGPTVINVMDALKVKRLNEDNRVVNQQHLHFRTVLKSDVPLARG
jgi:hypothetical protein